MRMRSGYVAQTSKGQQTIQRLDVAKDPRRTLGIKKHTAGLIEKN